MLRHSKRLRKKTRHKPAAHLLVIECRTSLLQRQHLAFGSSLHGELSSAYPDKTVTLAATDTREELTRRLAEVRTAHERYRAIVLVAHSNANGLQITDDDFCIRSTLASWLGALAPEHLFLVACDAGQFTGVCTLFDHQPSLLEVYASPVPISPAQAQHLTLLIRQLITDRRVDETTLRQGISFLAHRGVLFRWTRADCQAHNELPGTRIRAGRLRYAKRVYEKTAR